MKELADFAALWQVIEAKTDATIASLQAGLDAGAALLEADIKQQLAGEPALAARVHHTVHGSEAVVWLDGGELARRELGTVGRAPDPVFAAALDHCRVDIERVLDHSVGGG